MAYHVEVSFFHHLGLLCIQHAVIAFGFDVQIWSLLLLILTHLRKYL